MVNDFIEHARDKCYKRLWYRIVTEAVYDYVLHKRGSDHDTAFNFLSRQENLDASGLNMTPDELFDILDNIDQREMKKRRTEFYIKSEEDVTKGLY